MQVQESQKKLGVFSLVFFVVAAASPLTGFVGGYPVATLLGNGGGVPGSYVMAGLILLIFSVGYIAMSRHVKNAGAFYAYISEGLGPKLGISGLGLAILTYVSIYLCVAALFGLFTQIFITEFAGSSVPWWVYTLAMLALVCWLGIQKVEIGGRILGVLMIAEVLIAIVVATASISHAANTNTLDFTPFSPALVFQEGLGIALIFSLASFIGFEATAIYSEECVEPEKTIPRATLIAVLLITVFFVYCSWGIVQTFGASEMKAAVEKHTPDLFILNVAGMYFGKWIFVVINLLLITSLFAASQSFHNNLTRYFYTMGKNRIYWTKLADIHPTKGTPAVSSMGVGVSMAIIFVVLAVMGANPFLHVFTWGSAIATMSILVLQVFVCFAVINFFKKRQDVNEPTWKVTYMPVLAALGLLIMLALVLINIREFSGVQSSIVYLIPITVASAMVGGFIYSVIIQKVNSTVFHAFEKMVEEETHIP